MSRRARCLRWVTTIVLTAAAVLPGSGCSPGIVDRGGPDASEPDPDRVNETTFAGRLAAVRAAFLRGDLAAARTALEEAQRRADTAADRRVAAQYGTVIDLLAGASVDLDTAIRLADRHLDLQMVRAFSGLEAATTGGGYVHTRLGLYEAHRTGKSGPLSPLATRVKHERYRQAITRVSHQLGLRVAVRPSTIGVLLPLSGPYAQIGEAALRSIKLALGSSSGLRLVVKDTRGEAGAAARLVDHLVHQKNVVGILGPIGAFESTAATRRATELGVPILVLSGRQGVADEGPGVFRTRVTPSRQGARLARYAVTEMGLKRFGLLISDSSYGWALAGAFWTEVARLGARVTSAVSYRRGTSAYRSIVQRLVSAKKKTRAKPDFQGLLIADNHAAVRKLVPFFPYWGLRVRRRPGSKYGVQLLGGDAWNNHGIVDEAERQTDNAVFCDAFFPDEDDSRINAFVTRFYNKFREPPSPFEAEAFDATRLLLLALRKNKDRTRDGLRKALLGIRSFRGVTGVFRFDKRGDVIKDVTILTIDGDRIRLRNSEAEERALRKGRQ